MGGIFNVCRGSWPCSRSSWSPCSRSSWGPCSCSCGGIYSSCPRSWPGPGPGPGPRPGSGRLTIARLQSILGSPAAESSLSSASRTFLGSPAAESSLSFASRTFLGSPAAESRLSHAVAASRPDRGTGGFYVGAGFVSACNAAVWGVRRCLGLGGGWASWRKLTIRTAQRPPGRPLRAHLATGAHTAVGGGGGSPPWPCASSPTRAPTGATTAPWQGLTPRRDAPRRRQQAAFQILADERGFALARGRSAQ